MKTTSRARPQVEELETRLVPSYSFDGTGNNLAHPTWGAAGTDLLRKAAAAYADGISTVGGQNRPGARLISNTIADQGSDDIISDRFLSAMIYAWGQFLDHDFDLTPTGGTDVMHIPVPAGDPYFDPNNTGTQTIDTSRSVFNPATGTSTSNPRQQVNIVTAWLDGSMIYGSNTATANALRSFFRGRMKTSPGNLLPFNNTTYLPNGPLPMANDAHRVPDDQLFAAGDVRANENIELTSLHTLFVREHNFWADKFWSQNHSLSDEQLFQRARDRVIAELQAITFNQWLPALLGSGIGSYQGYNPNVNPGIANEFSAAGFRLGHSLLGDDVEFLDNQGRPVAEEVPLFDAFFNPPLVSANGISPILKYLASDPSSEMDNTVVGSVRNFLFGPPGSGGLDLASLNIQRGRDHGLADYNTVRAAYGLPKVASFAQITSNTAVQAKLQQLYGNVDNIDLWVGALAENHVSGGTVGKTLKAIITDQFGRLRSGDRFWYQRSFSNSTVADINNTTLGDIIKRNTLNNNLQTDVFFFKASISGTVFADLNHNGRFDFHDFGLKNKTVELVNEEEGEVIATAVTDNQGRYRFDVASGLRTGDYVVRIANKPVEKDVLISKGDTFLSGINLGLT